MISSEEAQKILDHFHIGKIKSFDYWVYYYEAQTNKGIFFILQSSSLSARDIEDKRAEKLKEKLGRIERLLLADFKDKKEEYSSYVHHQGKYYSVYKLAK